MKNLLSAKTHKNTRCFQHGSAGDSANPAASIATRCYLATTVIQAFGNKKIQLLELRDRTGGYDVYLSSIYEALENLLDKKQNEREENEKWHKRQRIGF
jgi:hypothetical protein